MALALAHPRMRVLEARFHQHSKKSGAPIAVARVLCDEEQTHIEPIALPAQRLEPFDTGALMKKLTFLVESAKPRPFEQLTTLRSQFWSFTEISTRLSSAG
jgi:hypothetical protein